MIHVDRTPKPNILAKNESTWLLNYKSKLISYNNYPTKATKSEMEKAANKYRHPEVKKEIKKMFSEKCAYCESHISHVDYGDIEHFRPKSRFPDYCFEWNNLLLACGICNDVKYKGVKFPEANEDGPFVNPVDEDPNDFFRFEFNMCRRERRHLMHPSEFKFGSALRDCEPERMRNGRRRLLLYEYLIGYCLQVAYFRAAKLRFITLISSI